MLSLSLQLCRRGVLGFPERRELYRYNADANGEIAWPLREIAHKMVVSLLTRIWLCDNNVSLQFSLNNEEP
jgi:hypothetical protein